MNLMNRAASGFISLLLIFSFMLSAFSSPALASDLDADALLKEGWAYFHGDGVPQDIVKGILDIPEEMGVLCIIAFGNKQQTLPPHSDDDLAWEKVHVDQFTQGEL